MKILLDPQIFNIQKYGGISRYYTEVFSALKKEKELNIELPLCNSENVYIKDSGLLAKNYKEILFKSLSTIGISTRTLRQKQTVNLLNHALEVKKFDLFVSTYYGCSFLDKLDDKPFVLTIYDMIHELYPQYFRNDPFEVVKNKKKLVEKATGIIAVSENTKKDIIRIYPHIDKNKIRVIHHGNSIKINKDVNIDLPEKYILFVGSRDNYKNFRFLTEAISNLLISDSELFLVCAGGGQFNQIEVELLNKMNLQKKVIQMPFEENQLGKIYNEAICFVFPSEYEGFGIPVLEAMACECPIILTNNSSFPEVAANAGIFFKLNDKQDLLNKVLKVIDDEVFRKNHIELGKQRVKLFNWEDKAKECYDFYKEIVKRNHV